jgi:hypothetical protein
MTEDGVPTAVTSLGPAHTGPLFRFEEELRLRQDPEVPESLLRFPRAFFRLEDGRYLVPDIGESSFVVFGADGSYQYRFGRRGEGPGEFQSPTLQYIEGEHLVVTDRVSGRTTVMDAEGNLVRIITPPPKVRTAMVLPAATDRYVGTQLAVDYLLPDTNRQHLVVSVYSAEWDTLWARSTDLVATDYVIRQFGRASAPIWYTARPMAGYLPGKGIYLSTGRDPLIEWFDLDGDPIEGVRLNIPADPVSDSLLASIEARWDRAVERSPEGFSKEFSRDQRRNLQVAEFKAFWDQVLLDSHGYYWLRRPMRYWDAQRERILSEYRLLSPDGEYLGDVAWPVQYGRVQDGYLMGIYEDPESGERIPIVYRMRSAIEGFDYP